MTSLPIPPVTNARLEKFFAKVKATARGRAIVCIDATASREACWGLATQLTAQMFEAVAAIGTLAAQLVYYRGADECAASAWTSDASALAKLMSSVMCRSGHTQIGKVLRHAAKEHARCPVNALVIISDACEEQPAILYALARDLGVKTFLFQEGDAPEVAEIYKEIARLTGGATAAFNASAAQRLADLLRAVGAYAAGGVQALAAQKNEAAALLLEQLKRGGEK